jgi:hypothetical protein
MSQVRGASCPSGKVDVDQGRTVHQACATTLTRTAGGIGPDERPWAMARTYALAQMHGGPLDGDVVQVPFRDDGRRPVEVVGVPVPVLDEASELFWWDTGNYFMISGNPPKRGEYWWYAFARTLPGYPTFTKDHHA